MDYTIDADQLAKRFGGTVALAGVNLRVRPGTVCAVLGPNGAGKTTAVRILTTLLAPDGGTATVGGFDVVRQAHQVRTLIGLTGQYGSLDLGLSGRENLYLIGRLVGLAAAEAYRRADELLATFDLVDAARRQAQTYSGGMARRLDLAACLVGRPSVLFLDEPTTGLDPRSRTTLWDILRGLVSDGTTVLLTTQYLEEADRLADRITVVDRGTVIAEGSSAELKARVGGQVLHVRTASPEHIELIRRIVTGLTDLPPVVEADAGLLTVPCSDTGLLRAVVDRIDDARLPIAEIALHGPSLDEVFLALTGHRSEPVATPVATPGRRRGPGRYGR